MSSPNPQHIVRKSPQISRVMYRDGDTGDIIRAIMYADRDSSKYIDSAGVQALQGPDTRATLQNIYDLMQGRIDYRADRPGHEIVRSPAYLFFSGAGDCKSYSVAIGAFCRAFGIPYRYRFTGSGRKYTHVYVVATLPDGTDVPMDAIPDSAGKYIRMGKERSARRALDLTPGQRVPAGIHGSPSFWTDTALLVAALILFFIFFSRSTRK